MKKLVLSLLAFTFSVITYGQREYNYGATPEDSIECRKNVSLYQSLYSTKEYVEALKYWREVMKYCPKFDVSVYKTGQRMLDVEIKNAGKDTSKRNPLLRELTWMYEMWIENIDADQGNIAKGNSLMRYYPKTRWKEAIGIMKDPIYRLGGKSDNPKGVYRYFLAITKAYQNKELSKEEVINEFGPLMKIVDEICKNQPKKCKSADWSKGKMNYLFEAIAPCEDLIPYFTKKFANGQGDLDELKVARNILFKKRCVKDPIYPEILVRIQKEEPSVDGALFLSKYYLGDSKCNLALDYYEQALAACDTCSNEEVVKQGYQVYYYCKKNTKGAALAKDNGDRDWNYLFRARMAASKSSICGDNAVTKASVYWVAYDYAAKAAQSDDKNCKKYAVGLMKTYRRGWPDLPMLFKESMENLEGKEYEVPCLGVKTIVRLRD